MEDLTAALSSSSWFTIISRNSAFAYKGQAFKVTDISRELGARYIVEGSVRRVGSRVRVTAQLIEGATGHHLWADHYDRELDDLFALQDDLTEAIAGVLVPLVASAEHSRAMEHSGRNLDSWASLHRGMVHLSKRLAAEHDEARQWFHRARELDPRWGLPLAMDALALVLAITYEQVDDVLAALQEARRIAEQAVLISPNDAEAQNALGWVTAFARQYDRSERAFQRGLDLNSSMAGSYHGLGFTRSMTGRPEEAIALLERSILLSPHDNQLNFRLGHLGQAHFQLGQCDEAIANVTAALELRDEYGFSYLLAAIHGLAGNSAAGREIVEHTRARYPDNSVAALQAFLSPELYDLHVEGLSKLDLA